MTIRPALGTYPSLITDDRDRGRGAARKLHEALREHGLSPRVSTVDTSRSVGIDLDREDAHRLAEILADRLEHREAA